MIIGNEVEEVEVVENGPRGRLLCWGISTREKVYTTTLLAEDSNLACVFQI